ncbi:MAG TPA: hypothetical protein VNZ22_16975, partial [Bacillota bacterium]|nr:hypothetical protein [Bacillota bacterium]
MKQTLLALCAGALALAASTGLAAPLQRADLPADPAWALHLDCDALRPTAIGRYIQSEMEKPEAQAKLAAFQSIFSFDLRTQLHSLTLYSIGTAPEDGVLLVYAEFNAGQLTTLAEAAKEHQSNAHNRHTIHSWIDENKKPKNGLQPRVYAAIQGKRVIFGQRQDRVAQALDVLDGAVPRLSTSGAFAQLGAAGNSSFLQAAARKLDLPNSDPNAAIFRLAKLINLQVGEAQQRVNATLTLEANDEDVAGHIASIAQGLLALMKLQKEKPESVKLAEALGLKQEGPRVVAHLGLPANDIIAMVKA